MTENLDYSAIDGGEIESQISQVISDLSVRNTSTDRAILSAEVLVRFQELGIVLDEASLEELVSEVITNSVESADSPRPTPQP